MVIAHVLSQNQLTGAEVYACQLISEQIDQLNQVYQISNDFFFPSQAQQIQLKVETKSFLQFIKNVFILKTLIRRHGIQVLHSHSRAAAKLVHWATLGTRATHVSTIHGRQHSSFSKRLMNMYGQFQIPVCENIEYQLVNELKYNPRQIKVIRNGIDLKKFTVIAQSSKSRDPSLFKIAIIGRMTGPKKDRTVNFIKQLMKIKPHNYQHISIDLIGADQPIENSRADIELNSIPLNYIKHSHLTSEIYGRYDLIVGSGRVCMEAALSQVPTIAFGEAQYLGLLREKNFSQFLASNFGDIANKDFGQPELTLQDLKRDLKDFGSINYSELQSIAKIAQDHFSLKYISHKIQKIYALAFFKKQHPAWIPVLMYHKVPLKDLSSPHKIYVNKENFERHLKFFKMLGFQTLTFNELKAFLELKTDLSQFPKKPLILTFDDGYQDNIDHAAPLLQKYGFKAQIFLLADPSVSHNFWDEETLTIADPIVSGAQRRLWKNPVFEIGSHGLNHKRITQMSESDALAELITSKKNLEDEFNTNICVFAYTYGDTNLKSAELAEKAGYDFAVNTDTGGLNLVDNPFQIFRVNIFPNETFLSLWKKTSRWYRTYYFRKRKH